MNELPLYRKYPGQLHPQPAHVEFDLEGGPLQPGFNGDIGNAVPVRVYNGVTRRIPVSPYVTEAALEEFLADPRVLELVDVVRTNSEVVWDGSNHVARLNETAEQALVELAARASRLDTYFPEDWAEVTWAGSTP